MAARSVVKTVAARCRTALGRGQTCGPSSAALGAPWGLLTRGGGGGGGGDRGIAACGTRPLAVLAAAGGSGRMVTSSDARTRNPRHGCNASSHPIDAAGGGVAPPLARLRGWKDPSPGDPWGHRRTGRGFHVSSSAAAAGNRDDDVADAEKGEGDAEDDVDDSDDDDDDDDDDADDDEADDDEAEAEDADKKRMESAEEEQDRDWASFTEDVKLPQVPILSEDDVPDVDPMKWYGGVAPATDLGYTPPVPGQSFCLWSQQFILSNNVATMDKEDVMHFWHLADGTEDEDEDDKEDDDEEEEEENVVVEGEKAKLEVLIHEDLPRGLKEEFEVSKSRRVMFRGVDLRARQAVEAGQHLLVDGLTGAGKTFTLVNLVAWARSSGYHVVYVPSGRRLVIESNYQKDEATGLWDTPEHAALFLKWAKAGNAGIFERIKVGDKSLTQLVKDAEEEYDKDFKEGAKMLVDTALMVIDEFKKLAGDEGSDGGGDKGKVMFVIDEYNALYGPTDMHEVLGPRKRGNIAAGQTRLISALRDAKTLTDAGCSFVGATSGTIMLSDKLSEKLGTPECPGSEALERFEVGRMDGDETLSMVMNYEFSMGGLGGVHQSVHPLHLAQRLKTLTQGNGKEIRECVSLL